MATKAHSEETDEKGTEECHPYPDGVGRRSCVEDVELGTSSTTEEELGPPDGGWGWMVTVGAFIIMNLLPMLPPCFGILFSRFLLDLGTSSTTTGWIFSTFCFVWNISSLFSRPLTKEFGWRAIAFTGILMVSSSLMVSAFAPTAEFLFISFSILGGAGCGMVVCICFCIVPLYFNKRRGQANAIMMAGAGMGQITGPPLIEYLLNEYTFKGAALIMGAVLLHGCIGALLFHPISWHQRRRPKSRSPGEVNTGEPLLHSQAKDATGVGVRTISIESIGDAREYKQVDNRLPATAVRNRLLKGRNSITSFGSSALGISFASGIDHIDNNSTHEEAHSCRCIELLSRILRTALSDIGILRSPRPLCISLGFALCVNSYINFAMMVPFAMQANGYSLQDSAICISVSAVFNLMMRITASFLSDWRRFHVKYCYMAALAVISVSTFVFPVMKTLLWMKVVIGAWGAGVGTKMSLTNLVIINVLGIEQLQRMIGASSFVVGVLFVTIGPAIGLVRDLSHSYEVSIWVLAALGALSFCLWVVMPAPKGHQEGSGATGDPTKE